MRTTLTIIVMLIWLAAIFGAGWVIYEAATSLHTMGLKGVIESLWCGQAGCAK